MAGCTNSWQYTAIQYCLVTVAKTFVWCLCVFGPAFSFEFVHPLHLMYTLWGLDCELPWMYYCTQKRFDLHAPPPLTPGTRLPLTLLSQCTRACQSFSGRGWGFLQKAKPHKHWRAAKCSQDIIFLAWGYLENVQGVWYVAWQVHLISMELLYAALVLVKLTSEIHFHRKRQASAQMQNSLGIVVASCHYSVARCKTSTAEHRIGLLA